MTHRRPIQTHPGRPRVAGVEWNQNTDTWRRLPGTVDSVDDMAPWKHITRVNLAPDGSINATYGRTGYTEDGSNGRVMVRIPATYFKARSPASGIYQWFVAEHRLPGFALHPAFFQRGGHPHGAIYVGAYPADLVGDAAGNHTLHSRANHQPTPGRLCFEVDFDGGQNEPDLLDTVDTPGGDEWVVQAYEVTSGSWAGNDAAGKLWIQQTYDNNPGWSNDETITNTTQSNTLATVDGSPAYIDFGPGHTNTYAENIGAGWGITNAWTRLGIIPLLMLLEWGDFDCQLQLGRGVVDKVHHNTQYRGELNAAFNINDNLDANLTGAGDDGLAGEAQDGLRPVAWRGMENPWGTHYEYVSGIQSEDSEWRIVKARGLSSPSIPTALTAGQYDATQGAPFSGDIDTVITDILFERLTHGIFLYNGTGSTPGTYIPNDCHPHDAGESDCIQVGGKYSGDHEAGILCTMNQYAADALDGASGHYAFGARLEYIPQ